MISIKKSLILLIVLIIGLFYLIEPTLSTKSSPSDSLSAEDKKLLKELYAKATNEGGIIELKLFETKKFLGGKSRPYDVLALFTSSNSKYGCSGCVQLKNNVLAYSNTYIPYLESENFFDKPIFIVVLEVDSNFEFFQSVKLTTIPHLVYIPSGSKPIETKGYQYTRFDQTTPDHISNFIQQHSKVRIEPVKTFYEKHQIKIFAAIVLIASIRFLITAYRKRNNPMFWYFLTILLFAAVIMGIFYDFIHKPALYDYDYRSQKFNYFSRGSRSQTISEGFIMGVSTLAITLVFIFIGDILPNNPNLRVSTKNILFFLGMGAMLTFLYFQSIAFAMKYYRPMFFIPSLSQ